MPFYGKCGFCGGNGHNIKMCFHPDKLLALNTLKTELADLRTKRDIRNYVDRLSPVQLEILASDIRIASGTPNMFIRKYVKNHFVCELETRERRWRQYMDELEENGGGRYHSAPPYSLFRRCIEVLSSLGMRAYRVASGRRDSVQYTQLDTRPTASSRRWRIIPSLEIANTKRKIECPICMDMKPVLNVVAPQCSCNHSMCKGCFGDLVNKSTKLAPKCPLCRATIQSVTVYDMSTYDEYCDKYLDE